MEQYEITMQKQHIHHAENNNLDVHMNTIQYLWIHMKSFDLNAFVFRVCDFCFLQTGFLGIQRGHFEIQRGHPRFFTKWPLGIFRCPKIWPQFWLYWFILVVVFWQTVPLYKMSTFSFLNLCPTTKWHVPATWGWTYPTCINTLVGAPLGPLQNAPSRPQGVNWQGDSISLYIYIL